MTDIKNFINQSIRYGAPVNFYKIEFRRKIKTRENQLICKNYETTKLRANEFHKPITCFLDYTLLRSISIKLME